MEDEVVDSRHYAQWTRDWIAKEEARLKAAGRSIFMARRMPLQPWQVAAYYGIDSDSDEDHNDGNQGEDLPSLNGSSQQLNDTIENVTSSSDSFGMHTLHDALSSPSLHGDESTLTEDPSADGQTLRRYPSRERRQPDRFQFGETQLRTPKRRRQKKRTVGGGGQKEVKVELKGEEDEEAEPEGRKKAKGETSQKAEGREARRKTKGMDMAKDETSQRAEGSQERRKTKGEASQKAEGQEGRRKTKGIGMAKGETSQMKGTTGLAEQPKGTKKAKKTAAEGSANRTLKA